MLNYHIYIYYRYIGSYTIYTLAGLQQLFSPLSIFSEIHSHHLCFGMIDLVVQHRTATGQYIHGLLEIARTIVGHIKMGTMSMRHKVLPHSLPSWLITFYN